MAHPPREQRLKEREALRAHEKRQRKAADDYARAHGPPELRHEGKEGKAMPPPENKMLPADEAVPANKDLSALTKAELYGLAQERDVEGRSDMTKAELVEALGG